MHQSRWEPGRHTLRHACVHEARAVRLEDAVRAVSADLAPSPPEHVAAGDLVIQGMEAAILVLLSAAVKHALESTNPIHAHGVADGPSRFGTHQVLLTLPVHR